jgi:hypothetical protein
MNQMQVPLPPLIPLQHLLQTALQLKIHQHPHLWVRMAIPIPNPTKFKYHLQWTKMVLC